MTGCSQYESVFFGIRVFRGAKVEDAFNNVRFGEKGNVLYNYRSDLADNAITCHASTGPTRIIFRIHNGSKQPIRMNYLADSYRLVTKDGRIFLLEIADPTAEYYGYPDLINPGQRANIYILYPSGVKMAEVEAAFIELDYGEVVIVLRKIEQQGGGV